LVAKLQPTYTSISTSKEEFCVANHTIYPNTFPATGWPLIGRIDEAYGNQQFAILAED